MEPSTSVVHVAVGVLRNALGEVLLARRPSGVHQGGKWEFPGGKVEHGEAVDAALRRELNEELGVTIGATRALMQLRHDYADRRVLLEVIEVEDFSGEARGREGQALEWVAPDELSRRSFPAANKPILRVLGLPTVCAITGRWAPGFLDRVDGALARGARLLQLRVEGVDEPALATLIKEVVARCRPAGAKLLVNGDPGLVEASQADGVHLNRHRLMAASRRPLGDEYLISASCHDRAELAHAAAIGVDFALLSPVLPTRSHPGAPTLGWEGFRELATAAPLPVYALGGMGLDDVELARAHGGYGVGVLGALWGR